MKRWLVLLLTAVVVVAGAGWLVLQNDDVDFWLFSRAVPRLFPSKPATIAGPNELSVLLCGTGSPLPDPTRAGPCTLIGAGDRLYLVDTGLDSGRNLLLWRVPLEKVAGIFITHLHSDHIGELGEIRLQTWVAGRKTPLEVYGPPGIERVVAGFNEAYAIDSGYRTAHHGAAFLPPDSADLVAVPVPLGTAPTTVALNSGGLVVTAIRVNHGPVKPAYGYRFDYAGRSVTVSGDTAPDENLARAALNTDVLVHEGLSPALVKVFELAAWNAGARRASKIFHDIPGYHSDPVEAAKIANQAHAGLLVFTHMLPVLTGAVAEHAFLRGVDAVRPSGVALGHDGWIARLPGGSKTIEVGEVR